MIQIAMVAVSIALVILGAKGFTKRGLSLTQKHTLKGTEAKVVGAICILLGIGLIPLLLLYSFAIIRLTSR